MTEDVLKITTADKIRLLTLNRPERRNALSAALSAALRSAVIEADGDPEVSLIAITGAGTAFCAGVDLRDARSIDESGGRLRAGPGLRPQGRRRHRLLRPARSQARHGRPLRVRRSAPDGPDGDRD